MSDHKRTKKSLEVINGTKLILILTETGQKITHAFFGVMTAW